MRFSLIIPVYKVENFIKRCVTSINEQTYTDFEVIFVDDGSPDKCPQICDSICSEFPNYYVVHKKNEGLGYARNTGLQYAKGDYIVFIDSDDYIEKNALEILNDNLSRFNNPDVCVFGHNIIDENGNKISKSKTINKFFKNEEVRNYVLPKAFCHSMRKPFDDYGIGSAWGSIYKREFLKFNNIKFKSEREYLSEDLLYSVEVCMKASSVLFIDSTLYNYCLNGASLSHSYRIDRLEKSIYLYKYMNKIVDENNFSSQISYRIIDNFFINIMVCLKQEIFSENSRKIKINNIRQIVNTKEFHSIDKNYPSKNLTFQRKLLFNAIKQKNVFLVILLILLKEKKCI